ILLPHVCEFNLISTPERYADIAQFMGIDIKDMTRSEAGKAGINAIRELSQSVGIPTGLTELGVKQEDLAIMATNAQNDACMLTNPRKANHEQVVAIFAAAM
ncbi:iron-containing alcohol dehydrogenase, partial [Salmonella enterica subsp. enterica serovar Enteritidis]|nr:iron-containing alcohol dehydrogenase [Salmonella enterica subsp. enterica serovar Enteritidis]